MCDSAEMTIRRVVAAVVAGVLMTPLAASPSYAAEPGFPTATFTLDRTTAYIEVIDGEQDRPIPQTFKITPHNVTDDVTAADDLVLELSRGDGSGFVATAFPCPGGTCTIEYDQPGTFTPQARLTDEDAHSTTINLPTVRVFRDTTDPVVRVIKPPKRKLHRISAWRVIRGTAVDRGVGVVRLDVAILQKRRGAWYYLEEYYVEATDTVRRHWVRGLRTEAATFSRYHPRSGSGHLVGNRWRTAWIRGLTRGPLVVRVDAMDANFFQTSYRKYAWVRLTRR